MPRWLTILLQVLAATGSIAGGFAGHPLIAAAITPIAGMLPSPFRRMHVDLR